MMEKDLGDLENTDCDCWLIEGYGIDGICLKCHNKKIKELKGDNN